jgi:hypothetical protein
MISPDQAQVLAAGLLQLNPLLGLTLIWSESHLQERDKESSVSERRNKPSPRERGARNNKPVTVLDRIKPYEWFFFVMFLHSITWSIVAAAAPAGWSIKTALAFSIIWLSLSVGRILVSIRPPDTKSNVLLWTSVTTAWFPLWSLVLLIQVGGK